jgi:hypothetical protein
MRKAAIVELSGDHHECIHSHVHLLSPRYETHIVGSSSIMTRRSAFPKATNYHEIQLSRNKLIRLTQLFLLASKLKREKYDLVMMNSLDQRVNRILVKLLPRRMGKFGVLHDLRNADNTLIRLDTIFVTNEHLKSRLDHPSALLFHPCFFIHGNTNSPKANDQIRIIVPGSIDAKRRDYKQLIEALPKLGDKFHLLIAGSVSSIEGQNLLEELRNSHSVCDIEFVSNLSDEKNFLQVVGSAHFILPLLNPILQSRYKTDKTSGSFNLSIGLCVPLILPKEFKEITPSRNSHVYYDENSLVDTINNLQITEVEFESGDKLNSQYINRLLEPGKV